MGVHETKTFRSGNSIALRLPKGLAIGADERMSIEQNGDVLTVRRVRDLAEEKRRLLKMLADLKALPKPPYVEERDPIEFPERPGL